jgi:exosome complex component RRP4
MIKQATSCRIIVGQNGLVWVDGEPDKENIAVNAIRKIENESHMPGLTDRMKVYLEEVTGVKISLNEGDYNGLQ